MNTVSGGDDGDQPLHSLLTLLSDGCFHSGQQLGEALNISRTAVWKHLQKLEALGVSLERVKGKGYCLAGGLELLSAPNILASVADAAKVHLSELEVLASTDSTNTHVMNQLLARGNGYICLAEQQTAGKGRRGRTWVSPFGKNIYLSLGWQYENGAAALEGLSLAVGVAIVDAIHRSGADDVQLKWPNDVLWRGRKLGGILLEMSGDPSGVCQVVVGVGVNVSMPEARAELIEQPWTDIESIMAAQGKSLQTSRNSLVANILTELLPLMAAYSSEGFCAYKNRWESLNAFGGKVVHLLSGNQVASGVMLGVTESGALRMQVAGQERVFHGGEVTLRAAL